MNADELGKFLDEAERLVASLKPGERVVLSGKRLSGLVAETRRLLEALEDIKEDPGLDGANAYEIASKALRGEA